MELTLYVNVPRAQPVRVWKLTDEDMYTRGETRWYLGREKRLLGKTPGNPQLCTGDVLHVYLTPYEALMNADNHGVGNYSRLFEARAWGAGALDGTKAGFRHVKLVREELDWRRRYAMPYGYDIYSAEPLFRAVCARQLDALGFVYPGEREALRVMLREGMNTTSRAFRAARASLVHRSLLDMLLEEDYAEAVDGTEISRHAFLGLQRATMRHFQGK